MKRLLVVLLALPICAVMLRAAEPRPQNSSVTLNDSDSDDCAQHLRVYNDDYSASVRGEESRTVPNQALNEVKLQINGSNITFTSPEPDGHSVGTLLLVKAPKGATLDLNVHNGGISVRGFNGVVKAHARNGGIALTRST